MVGLSSFTLSEQDPLIGLGSQKEKPTTLVLCRRPLLLQCVVPSLRPLALCSPLQVSWTQSVLWTSDQDLRAFPSMHGPHFTPQQRTSLLGSPQLTCEREQEQMREHTWSTWLRLLPQSAVWEPTLIEFEKAWKTQQTAIWMFAFEQSSVVQGAGVQPC